MRRITPRSKNSEAGCLQKHREHREHASPDSCQTWFWRAKRSRLRFYCAGGQYCLPIRRSFDDETCWECRKISRVYSRKFQTSYSRKISSRFQNHQRKSKNLFFPGKKQSHRNKARGIQESSPTGKEGNTSGSRFLRNVNAATTRKITMEYPSRFRSNKKRCLALPSRCRILGSYPYDQSWQDFVFSCEGTGMYKKRETWQRIRIWSSVSTWSYQRELCLCAGIQDGRYERQNQLHTSNRRTCEPVRKWRFKNSSGGQGLLEHEEQEGTYNTRHISGWFAKTITSQGTGYRLETARAPPQPTSGNRATHRTYQTRRTTGAKQNEKRSG